MTKKKRLAISLIGRFHLTVVLDQDQERTLRQYRQIFHFCILEPNDKPCWYLTHNVERR